MGIMTTLRKRPYRSQSPPPEGLARFAREIVIVLVVKAIALIAIWHVWFSAPARNDIDAARVSERIYSSDAAAPREGQSHARP
jgi:hypothetical protein